MFTGIFILSGLHLHLSQTPNLCSIGSKVEFHYKSMDIFDFTKVEERSVKDKRSPPTDPKEFT